MFRDVFIRAVVAGVLELEESGVVKYEYLRYTARCLCFCSVLPGRARSS